MLVILCIYILHYLANTLATSIVYFVILVAVVSIYSSWAGFEFCLIDHAKVGVLLSASSVYNLYTHASIETFQMKGNIWD